MYVSSPSGWPSIGRHSVSTNDQQPHLVMYPFRCVGLEWEMPSIRREEVSRISPGEFSSRFFAIRANRQQYTPGDERQVLTQAFTKCLDDCREGGYSDSNRRHRREILDDWKLDPYWSMASRRSGPPAPNAPSGSSRYESIGKLDPSKGHANSNMGGIPDGPRALREPYTPCDQVMTDYVIPPRDFLPLKDLTVSAFYDRFCNSNPAARKLKPWDTILSAYRDHVCKYYGNDLDFVWGAYKATNLDIPHNIRWKHCVALEEEIKQLNASSHSTSKRSRSSYDEKMPDTLPKRNKVEPASRSTETWGVSSNSGVNRKTPTAISAPEEASIPNGPSRLYSPSTPHLKVNWIHEQRSTEEDRRIVLPLNIAVKGIANKSQANNGSPAPVSRRSTGSTVHTRQASPVVTRTTASDSGARDDSVVPSSIVPTEAVTAPKQSNHHEQKELAPHSDVVVQKAVRGSDIGQDLLQSLIFREKGPAAVQQSGPAVQQSGPAENKEATSPIKENATDSKSTPGEPLSAAGKPDTLPSVPGLAASRSASPPASEPMTTSSILSVLSETGTTARTTSVQASTESIRSPLAPIEENQGSLPKSATKHVTRLEAFLEGTAKELEAGDEAITPQSIRLEALLQSATAELKALRSAMDSQPVALDGKPGSRKSVTTHIMRLTAFLDGAVIEYGLDDDKEITPHSISLEALLKSAVLELGVLKSVLAA